MANRQQWQQSPAFFWIVRLVLLAALLGAWQWGVQTGAIASYLFGEPVKVAQNFFNWFASGKIYYHLAITLLETAAALVLGSLLGFVAGLLLALNNFLERVLDPFLKALNAMPRVVLAPIFAVWFGLGPGSKIALGITLVFFVVFFNVLQGVREVSQTAIDSSRMLGADRRRLVRHVYVPSAMSWVFSSLHSAVGMAFVGAVIGEYLGSAAGVGYLILQAESVFDINTVIAGIALLTIFALLLDYGVTLVERRLLRWHPNFSNP
jgi:NitT/TauT family transport system permease protein